MSRFLYASAILPGKSDLVRQIFRRQQETNATAPWEKGLADAVGLEGWQAWLQRTPQRDYFIQCIETRNFLDFFSRFQEQVEVRNPYAVWLRDFYLTVLGKDFGHHSAAPTLYTSLSMDLPLPNPQRTEVVKQGYVLPLASDKFAAYVELCRQASGEYLYRFQEAYQRFGVSHISYFLQQTPAQNLVVIYQEKLLLPADQRNNLREIRAQFPACQWLSDSLTNLTGLPFDALQPTLEYLTPQPAMSL